MANPQPTEIVSQYLDDTGTGAGLKNYNGDYSSAVTECFISPPDGRTCAITQLIIYIEGAKGMANGDYGSIPALVNGVQVCSTIGGFLGDLTAGLPVQSNGAWKRLCYNQHIDTSGLGASNDSCAARWDLTASGSPVLLAPGDRLSVFLNDNLTGLVDHAFNAQGHFVRELQ
tara:strand:- start:1248 stop:1763 length:516 start_codon:yes stop_codon:yes gene_type:complete